jgi:diaminohydroxyphosphoribosylaminopyrimidine deaminase/5-amino-6-(5-phosphoribosylamino)uracil reductase
MDGIVVGIGTVLADDPLLTARPPGPRTPTRIVLDRKGRLPAESQLARTARENPTLVITTAKGEALLRRLGCEVFCVPADDRRPTVTPILEELGRRKMTNILVEGGSGVLGAFRDAWTLDEIHVFVAPMLVGGGEAVTAIGGLGGERIADAFRLAEWKTESLDDDLYIHGWPAGHA